MLCQKLDAEDEVMRLRDELEALRLTNTKHGRHIQTGKPVAKANTQTKRQVPQHTAESQDLVSPADIIKANGDPGRSHESVTDLTLILLQISIHC